jgi:WhiB family redox-sensing transcriptional regulator
MTPTRSATRQLRLPGPANTAGPAGAARVSWQERGACRGVDPALFFPGRGESTAQARAVCATCPVAAECLEHALTKTERFGIWGGTSERERKALRRARRTRSGAAA